MIAIKEELKIEVNEIKHILDLLSSLFNIRTAFLYDIRKEDYLREIAGNNGDFRPYCKVIQKELKHKCAACDKNKFLEASQNNKPLLYRCYNGLYEMFLPLFIENTIAGYLHFGQVRSEEPFEKIKIECGLEKHSDWNELQSLYNQMEVITKEKMLLTAELFSGIAENILKNKWVEIKKASPEFYLDQYIEENISQQISVKQAAQYIGKSISFVVHQFKKRHDTSFHEYVLNYRIQLARGYLKTRTINETYELCGFKNRYHFSKVFRKIVGVTPKKFQTNSVSEPAI